MSSASKLHIDLDKQVMIAEGSEEFLKTMYAEFDKRIQSLNTRPKSAAVQQMIDEVEEDASSSATLEEAARKSRTRRARRASTPPAGGERERVANYAPEMVKDLDLSGLADFCEPWAPKNHPERVLMYAHFLEEKLGIRPCTANQLYTCYRTLREKIPEVFLQALRDASGNRYGYVDYKSPKDVSVTTIGLNHLNGGLKKKAVNER